MLLKGQRPTGTNVRIEYEKRCLRDMKDTRLLATCCESRNVYVGEFPHQLPAVWGRTMYFNEITTIQIENPCCPILKSYIHGREQDQFLPYFGDVRYLAFPVNRVPSDQCYKFMASFCNLSILMFDAVGMFRAEETRKTLETKLGITEYVLEKMEDDVNGEVVVDEDGTEHDFVPAYFSPGY